MLKLSSNFTAKAIDRVLELSAEAHVNRREVGKGTPAYDKLTGAIKAYGKVLTILTGLQKREEFFAVVSDCDLFSGSAATVS
jgi:hypothetical protein